MGKEDDFSICKFIDEQMWFFTFYDFCDNRRRIKQLYLAMNPNEQLFYKWYVYANIHMRETFKNYIWDYLNDYYEEIDLLDKKRFYKAM